MDLLLVSIPKGFVLLELDISLYIRYSLSNSSMWDLDTHSSLIHHSKGISVFLADFSSTGSDTNCWDCEIPCPTLYYPISTILFTLSLIGKPAWIYFWFTSQKASYY
ncbi:hypothetical protein IGI04_037219 [Brassica rapa subsp. trilocularis]|uniref:Uncharacterized protein n=1 Tax=Brassica rapa subsp. trilocularis TaxID=1813537 RepID=A0ABQ7LGR7_BRACM|nr:hypothetical protein IGI04_037219 [Brassica rapa subsp. trilocularis]